jgi:hypothetical protein
VGKVVEESVGLHQRRRVKASAVSLSTHVITHLSPLFFSSHIGKMQKWISKLKAIETG